MPNIFPSIQTQGAGIVPYDTSVPQDSILGNVSAPSSSSVALTGAGNALQAAQDKYKADTPQKYDYSAHGVLGNIGHVLGRVGNIAGDILDPEAASLIPHSDLWNARRLYEDQGDVDKATENQAGAQRESDTVNNEQANRDAEQSKFDAEAPNRAAALASTEAGTAKTQQETTPLDVSSAATLNHLYNSKAFSAGMTPEETSRLVDAHKTMAEMKGRQEEFQARQQQSQQQHQDTEKDRALQRDIAMQNHQDTMTQHEGDTGRKVLDNAEKTYGNASQSADQMDQFINLAKQGNKAAGSMVPLEGALEITTANGVKRINRTEVDQYAGAGSLYDKVHGEISKLAVGKPIPDNVLNDMRQLSDVLRQGAYKNYSDTFDSAQKRYNLTNEEKKPAPGGSNGGVMFARDPQGKLHQAPAGTALPAGWKQEQR
jgi:hypothetical protein